MSLAAQILDVDEDLRDRRLTGLRGLSGRGRLSGRGLDPLEHHGLLLALALRAQLTRLSRRQRALPLLDRRVTSLLTLLLLRLALLLSLLQLLPRPGDRQVVLGLALALLHRCLALSGLRTLLARKRLSLALLHRRLALLHRRLALLHRRLALLHRRLALLHRRLALSGLRTLLARERLSLALLHRRLALPGLRTLAGLPLWRRWGLALALLQLRLPGRRLRAGLRLSLLLDLWLLRPLLLGLGLLRSLRAGRLPGLTAFGGRRLGRAFGEHDPWRGGERRHHRERQQRLPMSSFGLQSFGQDPLLRLRRVFCLSARPRSAGDYLHIAAGLWSWEPRAKVRTRASCAMCKSCLNNG
jgi:hypothetical protein